jgi:hypothetical protein
VNGHKKTPREKEVRKPGGLPDATTVVKQRRQKLLDGRSHKQQQQNSSNSYHQSALKIINLSPAVKRFWRKHYKKSKIFMIIIHRRPKENAPHFIRKVCRVPAKAPSTDSPQPRPSEFV